MNTVLIVDDSADVRFVIGTALAAAGYEVVSSSSAVEALEVLESRPIDVMVLDVMMPEFSGLELLQKIRSIKELRDLPVLVLSAMDEAKDRVFAIREGADDYLVKPADHDELAARVGRLMLRKRRAQIEGDLESLSLPQVLQNLSDSQKTGLFWVTTGETDAKICFDNGAIIGAQAGMLRGWDAVYHLLGLQGGRFRFNETDLPEVIDPLGTSINLHVTLLDLAYFEDELSRRETLLPNLDQPLETINGLTEELYTAHSSLPLREIFEAVKMGGPTTLRQMISRGLAAPIRISLSTVILLENKVLGLALAEKELLWEPTESVSAIDFTVDPTSRLFESFSKRGSSVHLLMLLQGRAWIELLEILKEIPDSYLTASRDKLFSQLESLQRGTVRLRSGKTEILLNLQLLDKRRKGKQGQALLNLASGILVWLTDGEFVDEVADLVDCFNEAPHFSRGVVVVSEDAQDRAPFEEIVSGSVNKWSLGQAPPINLDELTKLLASKTVA